MTTIYLAGPINGATDAEAHYWRDQLIRENPGFDFLDPMVRDYRGREDEAVEEIVNNDKADILSSDFVIAYCPKPSVGTSMEVYYAWEKLGPDRVLVVVPEGAPVSPWLRYHSAIVVQSTAAAMAHVLAYVATVAQ